jgi:hypothetical protein
MFRSRFNRAFCCRESGLSKISSAFTLTSFSRRDDTDDFFAIVVSAPIDVNH